MSGCSGKQRSVMAARGEEFKQIVTRVSGVVNNFPCPLLGSCKIPEGGQGDTLYSQQWISSTCWLSLDRVRVMVKWMDMWSSQVGRHTVVSGPWIVLEGIAV